MQAVYLQCIPPALVVQPLDNTIHSIYIYPRNNAIGSPNTYLAPVVQTLDCAMHRINHYPADKYYDNQLRYLLDRLFTGG